MIHVGFAKVQRPQKGSADRRRLIELVSGPADSFGRDSCPADPLLPNVGMELVSDTKTKTARG